MTFEEFEKSAEAELREQARLCFKQAADMAGGEWEKRTAFMLQAQFYMAELDRREAEKERKESARIALRDYRMEWVVIIMIGLEIVLSIWGIYLGTKESKEQQQIAQKQIEMLDKVEKAMTRAGNMSIVRP